MRLFRRTLLCLVVGVAAFGAAGWLLRPRSSWTITLSTVGRDDGFKSFSIIEPNVGFPIWIGWPLDWVEEVKQRRWRIMAIDPRNGSVMFDEHLLWSDDHDFEVVDDGSLILIAEKRDDVPPTSTFKRMSFSSTFSTLTLDGLWRINRRYGFAWRLQPVRIGFRFVAVDLVDGKERTGFDCLERHPFPPAEVSDLSEDGRWLAVCRLDEDGDFTSQEVEVWNVETGRRSHAISVPETNKIWNADCVDSANARLRINDSKVKLSAIRDDGSHRLLPHWTADLTAVEFLPTTDLPPDERGNPDRVADRTPTRDVWVSFDVETGETEFCVRVKGLDVVPWRRLPFPLLTGDIAGYFDRSGPGAECAFAAVPHCDEIVCRTFEPSLTSALPKALREWLPPQHRNDQSILTRWHDWNASEWRNVGCDQDQVLCQLRPNAYITRSHSWSVNSDELALQSWPLPPRDPKWPALGVAALCMSATWWACARRHRRRTLLASVGAA